jgi:5-methylcytosine-specific restriction endonuclease McrA
MGFTVDHVIPVSKGGSDTFDNVRAAHNSCNRRRGVKDPCQVLIPAA